MAAKLVVAPEAEQDVAEAHAWYEGRRIGLGEEFSAASMRVLRRFAAHLRCMLRFTKTIAAGWCVASRMRSSTSMSKAGSRSMAYFTPPAIPTNGVSVFSELVRSAA